MRILQDSPDPYQIRFTWPKWSRAVTVLDVPAAMRQIYPLSQWTRADHARFSVDFLAQANRVRAELLCVQNAAGRLYGDRGPWISGGFCAEWPRLIQDNCRALTQLWQAYSDRSLAHWQAAGRQARTWRRLRDTTEQRAREQRQQTARLPGLES
jgi:hypothetical protein